ncbi:chain-length determining protein [Photobacterium kishitanii]|uniref:Chain-length determining protein n=2 Tax=Photobacterium kishitanii TaxID=318456 RepID=A0AAX0Z048_9GAMM|nr:chain-length determining protein [Photobacterium kishitanii]KJG56597.1 chain-length determining protein [Photobacterium kishitanii]KJG61082.1 chain-length determining protein [Photobacterium kishitanii]PSX21031.1 chain-length determining protein [Photobacterium kishitanii]PSX29834.1 chain-length determining protein [Photobacterium kishitanii]PSX35246.1 chain-length determining protein [Photobacterium kishitanii]
MISLSQRFYIILTAAWRRRYMIVIPIFIMPFIGLVIAKLSPKHYESHTSMLIQETAKMNPFLEDLAVSTMLKERLSALQTLLHSRHILGLVAEERGYTHKSMSPQEIDKAIAQLSKSLTVRMAGKDLIRIDYRSNNPDRMKTTLETISRYFTDQLLAPERSSMKDSSQFLAEHIKFRRKELDIAEEELVDFKNRENTTHPEMQLSSLDRLAKLKQRLYERQAELAGAKKRLGSIDLQLSKTNPVIGKLEEQIIKIRAELTLLQAKYTPKHSQIQGRLRNLTRLQKERARLLSQKPAGLSTEQLWDIASSNPGKNIAQSPPILLSQLEELQEATAKVDALEEETRVLEVIITEIEKKVASFSQNEKQLAQLQRDLVLKRQLYNDLVNRFEMAKLTRSLGVFEQEKRIKIIDRPYTPTSPSNFPSYFFAIAGFIGGIGLGAGLAFLTEVCDTSIRRKDQITMLSSVPILSRIPKQSEITNKNQ